MTDLRSTRSHLDSTAGYLIHGIQSSIVLSMDALSVCGASHYLLAPLEVCLALKIDSEESTIHTPLKGGFSGRAFPKLCELDIEWATIDFISLLAEDHQVFALLPLILVGSNQISRRTISERLFHFLRCLRLDSLPNLRVKCHFPA